MRFARKIAVSAGSDRSKADQARTTWLPPAEGHRCTYVTDRVADKTRWGLSVDAAEQGAPNRDLEPLPTQPYHGHVDPVATPTRTRARRGGPDDAESQRRFHGSAS
ncbi:hypothetical protein [Streptomyces carpinensis]|uniref:Uncharacterized protein n=1 Tax=Streptomyces carpinensis TaxID=66369 RepID=A0ABV1WAG5_9ACTN|nr:hypothetical protein [Streptomyces carpinensis]